MASACRFCGTQLRTTFVDLGLSPLSNAFIRPDQLAAPEKLYPLHVYVCDSCFLVQLEEFESPEQIFSDYLYFSSYSDSWLKHAKAFCETAIDRFRLTEQSFVMEVASNDGYLLSNFVQRGIPCLGIEPAANVARVAQEKGIPTEIVFFGKATAAELVEEHGRANLIVANNVVAHVPDINDFVAGLKTALASSGVVSAEFPHLLRLIQHNQFDTIYHEHFSYLSLLTIEKIYASHGLTVIGVEELPTHGGSLRVTACHSDHGVQAGDSVAKMRELESEAGLNCTRPYARFADGVYNTKKQLTAFLDTALREHKSVVAYGAAAKGNTLLNFCGIGSDLIQYVVDRNPHKQGMYLPGSHIPVLPPEKIHETKPHYVLILPWNLREEVCQQLALIRSWDGRFVVPIPSLEVF